MDRIPLRELRNHGGAVVDRVLAGEHLTITRAGKPIAELRPIGATPLKASVLLERWRPLPRLDPQKLRQDLDSVIDPQL